MELDGSPMKGTISANRIKLFYSREYKSYAKQIKEISDSDSMDEMDVDQIVQDDPDDYLPSNTAHRDLDPNLLTSYRRTPPDWGEIWNKWKNKSSGH
jgi:hypothetical protein